MENTLIKFNEIDADFNLYKKDSFNIMHETTKKLSQHHYKELENVVIMGLRNKGYYFDNKIHLEEFVKENCKIEDNVNLKEKVYFVKEEPFLLHKYDFDIKFNQDNRTTTLTASLGSYHYM
jgi:hypothetical protein